MISPPVTPGALRAEERWALAVLGLVILITLGWWALALWPLPDTAPEWLARTREVCFGNPRNALPPPGGWILLVSQPVGMLMVLFTVWGGALGSGLGRVAASRSGRMLLGSASLVLLGGLAAVGWRVSTAGEAFAATRDPGPGRVVALSDPAPALRLVDQQGDTVALEQFRGRAILVTFAFANCETVCPMLVRSALNARRRFGQEVVAIIVTLDPWRDTPSRLPSIATRWWLEADEYVVSGRVEAVEFVLDRWKVPRVRNLSTGEVIHPSVTYVVGPRGELAYVTDGTSGAVEQALAMIVSPGE